MSKPPVSSMSMMDLFRAEAETHTKAIVDGLLEVEQGRAGQDTYGRLMRAAHSVKGAGRIVGVDGVVKVAHAMEDFFVAAQQGKVKPDASSADILLGAVDMIRAIAGGAAAEKGSPEAVAASIREIFEKGKPAPVSPTPVCTAPAAPEPGSPAPAAPVPATPAPPARAPDDDRAVKVSASTMNRVMGLVGETVVQSRWLRNYVDSMLDLQARRIMLSDAISEIQRQASDARLPSLMASVSGANEDLRKLGDHIGTMTADLEASQRRLSGICEQLYRVAQASRMRPFSDGVQAFPRMVRDLARSLGKKIAFRIEGEDAPVDRDILEKLESPLTHLLRNSVDHGVEAPQARAAAGKPEEGTVTLSARHSGGNLAISISDDGAGIDAEALKKTIIEKGLSTARMLGGMSEAELFEFMFLPGFSTKKEVTEISGRGVGLDVVRSMLREVGGSVQVVSKAGAGARFEMSLPLTLSVIRALIVEIDGDPYAFALSRVESCLKVGAGEIMLAGEHPYISHLGQSIGIAEARDLLGFSPRSGETGTRSLVVISGGSGRLAICVDRFVGERDIVVRPLGALLGKVPDVLAASITEDGAPLLILDVDDFARSAHRHLSKPQAAEAEGDRHEGGGEKSKRILVVDDSLTVREVERRLLEGRGYAVDVAVDGAEAWNAVRSRSYDLVVTDVDMPRLNGIELVRLIKGDPRLSLMPVMIVSYKDSQEDRMKGLDAGASYYFNKGSFDDDRLLTAISDLIGDA